MATVGPGGAGRGATSGGSFQARLRHRLPTGRRPRRHRVSVTSYVRRLDALCVTHYLCFYIKRVLHVTAVTSVKIVHFCRPKECALFVLLTLNLTNYVSMYI